MSLMSSTASPLGMVSGGTMERMRVYSVLRIFAIWVFGPCPGRTQMTCPVMRFPPSMRSPMRSSVLWRANSLSKRIGSLLMISSPRMTTAFSMEPPLMRPLSRRGLTSS